MFQPQTLEIERLIASGAIGELRTMFAAFGFTIADAGNIRLDPGLGGGALMDAGCYPVSFVRQVFGCRPVRIAAIASSGIQIGPVPVRCNMIPSG